MTEEREEEEGSTTIVTEEREEEPGGVSQLQVPPGKADVKAQSGPRVEHSAVSQRLGMPRPQVLQSASTQTVGSMTTVEEEERERELGMTEEREEEVGGVTEEREEEREEKTGTEQLHSPPVRGGS